MDHNQGDTQTPPLQLEQRPPVKNHTLSYTTFLKLVDINSVKNTTNKDLQSFESFSILIPYRSFTGKFRLPLYQDLFKDLMITGSTPKDNDTGGFYYPELDDKQFLFDDFIVNPRFKYDLEAVKRLLNDQLQKNRSKLTYEQAHCVMQYMMYLTYEDVDKELHIVLIGMIENAKNLYAVSHQNKSALNVLEILVMLRQIEEAIQIYSTDLNIYSSGEDENQMNFKFPLFPSYPSISSRGIWKYGNGQFKLSLFYPYFADTIDHFHSLSKDRRIDPGHFLRRALNERDREQIYSLQIQSLGLLGAWIFLKNERVDDADEVVFDGISDPKEVTIQNCENLITKASKAPEKHFPREMDDLQDRLFDMVNSASHQLKRKLPEIRQYKNSFAYKYSITGMLEYRKINIRKLFRMHFIEKLRDQKKLQSGTSPSKINFEHDCDAFNHFEFVRTVIDHLQDKDIKGPEEDFLKVQKLRVQEGMIEGQKNPVLREQLLKEMAGKVCFSFQIKFAKSQADGSYLESAPEDMRVIVVECEYFVTKNFLDIKAYCPAVTMSVEFGDELSKLLNIINQEIPYLSGEVDTKRTLILKSAITTSAFQDYLMALITTMEMTYIPIIIIARHLNYILEFEKFGWISENREQISATTRALITSYGEYVKKILYNEYHESEQEFGKNDLTPAETEIFSFVRRNYKEWDSFSFYKMNPSLLTDEKKKDIQNVTTVTSERNLYSQSGSKSMGSQMSGFQPVHNSSARFHAGQQEPKVPGYNQHSTGTGGNFKP